VFVYHGLRVCGHKHIIIICDRLRKSCTTVEWARWRHRMKLHEIAPPPEMKGWLRSWCQRKLENEQRKSYRILISSCCAIDIRLFDFCRKQGLGLDQSHYIQSRLWSRLHTTLAQIRQITPSEYTLNTLYWKFFHRSGLLSNFALALKTEFALKFFTVLNTFLPFRILSNLRVLWKTECAPNSLY